ncbi:MAG: DNA/RNA non-specific endonuclease [Phycisphaerales bacterium]|nr:MAG: DNA/RNA non-specific endonuclease [Phycisphaerales bacterium]
MGGDKLARAVCLVCVQLSFLQFLPGTSTAVTVDVNWPLWDNKTPEPHTIFGEPVYINHDPRHNTTRKYKAFTVYYDDRVLAARWTAIKLTPHVVVKNAVSRRQGPLATDTALAQKGYKVTSGRDYTGPAMAAAWSAGQMVSLGSALAYGQQAARESMYTSNICLQLSGYNSSTWARLEQLCTEFARDYRGVWIYTGPIYPDPRKAFAAAGTVPAPVAFYKIVVSPGEAGTVDVLALRVPHWPLPPDAELSRYLVSIRDIERETGLDFLHELPDELEGAIESAIWDIWPDVPNRPYAGGKGRKNRTPDVIFVPTPPEVVDRMLELAKVTKDDLVYDLGCGDGRIVVAAAKKYGCRAVGYDIDPKRVRESQENVAKNNVGRLVRIEQKDIFTLDLSRADVITLYLLPKLNVRLIPQLEKLKPGSRIVSHDFNMKGVRPDEVVRLTTGHAQHNIFLWTAPLKKVTEEEPAASEEHGS